MIMPGRSPRRVWEELERVRAMNPLAIELNEFIREGNEHVYAMLSALGRELFFPRGILTQSAEARSGATRYNATIGIATEHGSPMYLPALMDRFRAMPPESLFDYAPATGLMQLRSAWRIHIAEANPSLSGRTFSLPVVTSGITHGLSLAADLFFNAGDVLVLPDKIWGNYRLIFGVRRAAEIITYPLFDSAGGFNVAGLAGAIRSASRKPKVGVLFNFPNNPTGYSISSDEAAAIVEVLLDALDGGQNILAIIDDAYFGLFYEDSALRESLFGMLAGLHPRLLSLKLDGATKEDFAWGFRVGFISFACGGRLPETVYGALEKKLAGAIRGAVSNCSMPAQSVLYEALLDSTIADQKLEKYQILKERAARVKSVLEHKKYNEYWEPYPFNSGYFMCLRLKGLQAEDLRLHLLSHHQVGVIALGETEIRIAFSCLEIEEIEDLFEVLYIACAELKAQRSNT